MPFKKAKRIRCNNCGQFNHTQVECKRKAKTPTIRVTKRIRCEICGQFNHTQTDCKRNAKISAMNAGKATTSERRNTTVTLKRMFKTQNTCNRTGAAYSTRISDGFRCTILRNNQSDVIIENIPQSSTSSQDKISSLTPTNSSQTQPSMHDSLQETASSQSTVTETNLSNKEPESNSIFPNMASTDAQENVYKESNKSSSWNSSSILTPEQIVMLYKITDEMMMECADSEFTRAIYDQSAEVNKQDFENSIINQVPEVQFNSSGHSDLKVRKPSEINPESSCAIKVKSIDNDDDQMNTAQHSFASRSSAVKDMERNRVIDRIPVPVISAIRIASDEPGKNSRDKDVCRLNSGFLYTSTAEDLRVKSELEESIRTTEEPIYFAWSTCQDESDSNLKIEEVHESTVASATDISSIDDEDEIEVIHEHVDMTMDADKCINSSSANTAEKTEVVNESHKVYINDAEQSSSVLLEFAAQNSSIFNTSEIAKLNSFRDKILNAKLKAAELSISSLMEYIEENSAVFKDTDIAMLQNFHSKIHKIEIR